MIDSLSEIVNNIKIPPMIRIRQNFSQEKIAEDSIQQIVIEQLKMVNSSNKIKPGMNIAITSGSRGIANSALIIKTIVDYVKALGANPFIVPAMGSHGGATAAGQLEVLSAYGITEQNMNCPIKAGMDVVCIGSTPEGHKVCIDKIAASADGIIPFCRIKPHTAFTGSIESGIMKMLTIGLGNHHGATYCHDIGYKHFHKLIPMFGQTIIENTPVLFAVATLENAYDQTKKIVAVDAADVLTSEPKLLLEAKSMMPRLLFNEYDILIVDKIGKDISGAGMDPHITGSYATPYAHGANRAQVIGVLDLTDATHGNGIGIGQADITTQRLWNKMILNDGYANAIVSNMLSTVKVPLIVDNDREVIQIAIKCCEGIDKTKPRIIRIQDTLHLESLLITGALLEEAKEQANIEILSDYEQMPFNSQGNLW